MMDDQSWTIQQLVIKIGHRLSGREVLVPSDKVDRISYEESTVFVNLTVGALDALPTLHLDATGAGILAAV